MFLPKLQPIRLTPTFLEQCRCVYLAPTELQRLISLVRLGPHGHDLIYPVLGMERKSPMAGLYEINTEVRNRYGFPQMAAPRFLYLGSWRGNPIPTFFLSLYGDQSNGLHSPLTKEQMTGIDVTSAAIAVKYIQAKA